MILLTGAAGFIGSCFLSYLNEKGIDEIIIVDDFSRADKSRNWQEKSYKFKVERKELFQWLQDQKITIDVVFHLGARTDTTEKDQAIFDDLNLNYTKGLVHYCTAHQIPLIYASSGATYGLGMSGYSDQLEPKALSPLNPYGDSKNDLDAWLMTQEKQPPFWAGLKFFNVYGPNEYHKGRMASVILHTYRKIQATGTMSLFRSHRADVADGQQSRDFIYVKDVLDIMYFMYEKQPESGLYNVGTGQARSFMDLATQTFLALGLEPKIGFIDTPIDIRDTYQYFTEADLEKLRKAGYTNDFYSLEDGIKDYVQQYLMQDTIY
ncbi:MAG: ADP-glyceromanno-heptose 6-epimerase [Saprospiraceae bacterium]|nr:ADP-glyceromanno-heptose 6-epimerase [Saprospiraceae bacterium]